MSRCLTRRKMGSKVSTHGEKCYDHRDPTLMFVDEEDQLDFLCEGFHSPRAQMSCGHAVTPTSLTNWCRKQLEQGESRFVCGAFGCGAEWMYAEVSRMGLLTPEERQYFEKTMARNSTETRPCPGCRTPVARAGGPGLRVRCGACTATRGRPYDFCWQCGREWRDPQPPHPPQRPPHLGPDRCPNPGCLNPSLETLSTCPDVVLGCVRGGGGGCPSIRACPTCGCLLEHGNNNCKHLLCPRCRTKFCFLCLRLYAECSRTSSITGPCASGAAPRQTRIPHWEEK
ncbi:unnamed protein product [Menidia menidia]|uniref:(Atlantic silverside) hypothetical protein n=1 Tax=Menidia menidia TaxID=238744 RepID=A0A8S4AQF5_9TELE|nr:unnamed protein product [Menidia menidia]